MHIYIFTTSSFVVHPKRTTVNYPPLEIPSPIQVLTDGGDRITGGVNSSMI